MSIRKSILLTLLLILIININQVLLGYMFFKTEIVPELLKNHIGITSIISFVIAYLMMFKMFSKERLNFKNSLNLKDFELKFLPYLFTIAIGLQLLDRPFWDIGRIWKYLKYSEFETDFSSFIGFSPVFFYSSLSTLIVAPIFEELFFRNFLLVKLIEKNSRIVAILISSVCFAIIHIETPFNLIPTFVFGLISSLVYLRTQKIAYSIILHFIINLFARIFYVLDFPLDRWMFSLNFNYAYWLFFLIGIVVTYFGTKQFLSLAKKKNFKI